VPLDWDEAGAFGSTQREVSRVLRGLPKLAAPLPLLEVETYTWGVLGSFAGDAPLHDRIARELAWVAGELAAAGLRPEPLSSSPR
jgi:hypothetical protein